MEQKSNGALMSAIVIIILLIIGGIFFWKTSVKDKVGEPTISETAPVNGVENDLSNLEKDLNSLDLNNLDTDL
jgi:multisubunit Na+/H+ antiporter MnhB subunit